MGSTFGKARKYNVHSMDSSTFKYQTASEDEMKPQISVIDKDLFSNHQTSSVRNRVEKNNSKLKTTFEGESMFDPAHIMPDYYNLRVNEDLLATQNMKKSSSNTLCEEGDYITLKEPPFSTPTPPPLPDDGIPPPLPPRNKVHLKPSNYFTKKSHTEFNSNPKPNQKVYSAEDIDRLLRPLIEQNISNRRSIASLAPDGNHHISRYQPRYHCHHVCDCHRYNAPRIYHEFSSPPPYNFTGYTHDTGQNIHYPNKLHDSIVYRHNHPHYHTASSQSGEPSMPRNNYNTVPVDRNGHHHRFQTHSPPSNSSSIDTSNTHKTSHPKYSQNTIQTQKTQKPSTFKEEKVLAFRHKRDPLYQSEVFSHSDVRSDPATYRSLTLQPCYTIPEEGSWLPQFHYDPAVYHSQRRSYHH